MRSESVIALRSFLLAALGAASAGCGGVATDDVPSDAGPTDGGSADASTTDAGKTDGGIKPDAAVIEACSAPKPVLVGGQDTGFDDCNGRVVRRAAKTCPSLLPRAAAVCPLGDAGGATCSSDSDCKDKPNGYCAVGFDVGCGCAYGCLSDSDCAPTQICMCGDPVGRCVESTCKDPSSCGGRACAGYDSSLGCGFVRFACATASDTCTSDAECAKAGPGGYCVVDATSKVWGCQQGGCAIGRPFVVAGETRTAPATGRGDWQLATRTAMPDDETCARLALHWSEVARLEHGSIASFARFTLELLALGAGPELVAGAQAAMGDEIRHARIAFGIASAYGAKPIGPGELSIEGALEPISLETFVERLVREGCVGETLGALEAAEAALRAESPVLRDSLGTIARDEADHAALAWRTLRFAVAKGGEAIARLADQTIDRALADLQEQLAATTPLEGLEAYGALSTSTRRELHADAARALLPQVRSAARSSAESTVSGARVAPLRS